jgi:hypothetical protein
MHYPCLPVGIYDVYGEPHEEGMDTLVPFEDESLSLAQ